MVTDRLFQSSDNQDLFFRENIRCLFFISDDLDDLDDLDKSCLVLLQETLQGQKQWPPIFHIKFRNTAPPTVGEEAT